MEVPEMTLQPITELLHQWEGGDMGALDRLVEALYVDLRRISHRLMAKERPTHTLDPTALVNEVYLKLADLKHISFDDRNRFLGFVVRVMRRILVEYARGYSAKKRGGHFQRVELDIATLPDFSEPLDLLILNEALEQLEPVDGFLVKLIELRFFVGLTEREAASVLGVDRTRVQREWRSGKLLLMRFFAGEKNE